MRLKRTLLIGIFVVFSAVHIGDLILEKLKMGISWKSDNPAVERIEAISGLPLPSSSSDVRTFEYKLYSNHFLGSFKASKDEVYKWEQELQLPKEYHLDVTSEDPNLRFVRLKLNKKETVFGGFN